MAKTRPAKPLIDHMDNINLLIIHLHKLSTEYSDALRFHHNLEVNNYLFLAGEDSLEGHVHY